MNYYFRNFKHFLIFLVSFFSEEMIREAIGGCKDPCVMRLDATSSVVENWPNKDEGKPPYTLLEFLSSSQNVQSLSRQLFNQWYVTEHLNFKPKTVVTDFSWALMHSVCKAFNSLSLRQQLRCQWNALIGEEIEHILVFLRLCASHFIKSVVRYLKEKLPLKPDVSFFII